MARVKRGVTSKAKHKKVLKAVKGQWGRRKNTIRVAKQAMEKSMQYAYRDRRNKKRDFKSLWITRINAGVRAEGMTYSKFVNGLSKSGINPIVLNLDEIKPFLPKSSVLISFISSMLKSFSSFDINWSLIFFISDILVDYFLKK